MGKLEKDEEAIDRIMERFEKNRIEIDRLMDAILVNLRESLSEEDFKRFEEETQKLIAKEEREASRILN